MFVYTLMGVVFCLSAFRLHLLFKLPAANVPLRALKEGVQKINFSVLKYVRHSLVYRELVDQLSDFQ